MSSNLQALDDFPSFTGEESPQEQIRQLQNYLFVVAEQLKYTMRNLGVDNLNPKQWDAMKEETLRGLIANYIIAGILKSKDGKTFYLDLDKGVLKMEATEFSVKGKTVAEAAMDGMSQMDVFNKLFDNGKVQGFEIVDGKLYINGEFATIVNLAAENIVGVENLVAEKLKSTKENSTLSINGAQLSLSTDGENTFEIYNYEDGVARLYFQDKGNKTRVNMGAGFLFLGENCGIYPDAAICDRKKLPSGRSLLSIDEIAANDDENAPPFVFLGKTASWKQNSDGTYTMIGNDMR